MTTTTKMTTTKPKVVKAKTTAIPKLPNIPFCYEVLEAASKQRTKAKKIEVLKTYAHDSIMAVLIWNFDESVKSMLPDGDVPFKKNEAPAGTEHLHLAYEWKKLYNFVKGGNDVLRPMKREQLFMQLLEGLHPDEAEIICLVKDKNLKKKYKLTRAIVEEAFPDIQWGNRS